VFLNWNRGISRATRMRTKKGRKLVAFKFIYLLYTKNQNYIITKKKGAFHFQVDFLNFPDCII